MIKEGCLGGKDAEVIRRLKMRLSQVNLKR